MARKPKSIKSSTPQKPKITRGVEKPGLEEVPISPRILALSKNFNESNVVTYEEGANPSQWAFHKIPPYLVPFVRDPTFENLQQILAHESGGWWYYSHPIVIEQIRYLLSIPKWCEEDWTEMGWTYQEYDGVSFPTLDSKYLDLINHALQSLIETQAKGFLPGYCITWKAVKKLGRRKSMPYHGDGDDTTKNIKIMVKDITEFKGYIDKKIGKRLKSGHGSWTPPPLKRLRKLLRRASTGSVLPVLLYHPTEATSSQTHSTLPSLPKNKIGVIGLPNSSIGTLISRHCSKTLRRKSTNTVIPGKNP